MRPSYTLEIVFLVMVIALSLVGFSSLALGSQVELTAYHLLHIIASLSWLALWLSQLVLIRQHRFERHRAIRYVHFFRGTGADRELGAPVRAFSGQRCRGRPRG